MSIEKEVFGFGHAWESEYGYAQAVRAGDKLYISGQVGHDERGSFEGFETTHEQMQAAYANTARILARFGSGMEDLVEEIIFATDMDEAFSARKALGSRVFGGRSMAIASTIVQVQRLAFPNLKVEIRSVAKLDRPD